MSATTTAAPVPTGAKAQGGILEGLNPIAYSAKDPINLFIIQATIIIIFCRLLHYPLSKLGQPRVIAEVIGGIVLGPTAMMRIPGFQENIFPPLSMPVLSNVANLGLLLFLFLIGLEVDTRMFRSNWKVAMAVGAAGMILPFGLGFGIAWGLYNQFRNEGGASDISFGTYGLFIGTALAITAFPVLCRILSELQLLHEPVGVTVLAAGIGNDVAGWVLLALSVALVNNSSGLTALYVLLTAVGWTAFLIFAVRPGFYWILKRSGSLQNGPSPGIIALTLLLVLVSAWFTAAIGVHAIFGAFLAGVICPHDGGFAIKLTEKIEDLVTVLLLPLYFALSGLNTNIGLLNDGITWAYVIGVIAVAFTGKIIGGMVAARLCKLLWRESMAIGVLMSCKGLVELIVLNIGLQANILTQRTFTIFVVMALVTTFATTPLAKLVYPMSYRKKVEKWKRGEIDWDGNPLLSEAHQTEERMARALNKAQTHRVLVHLRLDTLSGLFGLIALLGGARKTGDSLTSPHDAASDVAQPGTEASNLEANEKGSSDEHGTQSPSEKQALEVHGMRLIELTDRTSSVMQSAELDDIAGQDSVFSAFQTFSQLNGVAVAGHMAAVPISAYAETLVDRAREASTDLILLPWSNHGSLTEDTSLSTIGELVAPTERFHSRQHIDFVQTALQQASCNLGIYIGPGPKDLGSKKPGLTRSRTGISVQSARDGVVLRPAHQAQHVFFPFVGGKDDRAAFLFVLQLAQNANVSVTIAHVDFSQDESAIDEPSPAHGADAYANKSGVKATITGPSAGDLELLSSARHTISTTGLENRVSIVEINALSVGDVPEQAVELARKTVGKFRSSDDIIVVGRHHPSLVSLFTGYEGGLERDFQKTVGVLGDRFARSGINAGLLVMAGERDEQSGKVAYA